MKATVIMLLITTMVYAAHAQNGISHSATKATRYGGGLELAGHVPLGSGNIGVLFGGEYAFSMAQATSTEHYLGAVSALSLIVGDETFLYCGGGYKYNMHSRRGQPLVVAGIESTYIGVAAKMFISRYNNYNNGFGAALVVYPTGGLLGIGGVFEQEYGCNIFGGKIVLRFGESSYTSNSRSRSKVCYHCPY